MSDKEIKITKNKYPEKERHFHITIHKKYAMIIALIGIVIALGLLKVLFFHSAPPPPLQSSTKMKLYTDKNNNFTIEIPANWEITSNTAQGTTGLNTGHPVTQKIEVSQMYLPGKVGVTIQTYKATPTCPLDPPVTTRIANLPAAYDTAQHTWTIYTTDATMVITIAYPGSGGFMEETATPSSQEISQDIKLLQQVIQTLKLTNTQPFSC